MSSLFFMCYDKEIMLFPNPQVLPSLREKKDELLLKELLEQWSNYKIMNKYMFKFFCYLERHYIRGRNGRPTLELTAFSSFYSLVYDEMHKKVMDAILAMIARKRAGESIDEKLINDALAFYLEIGVKTRRNEPKCFVETMMKENAIMHGASN
ncbi:putative cullin-like protein 2 [Trifolium pratense]|uniref:putative cullin-like protein 2 n=1 Tax=Trifolium pratense TaxID=57577 RepID=UPI001E696982|nr:putative cullin-like protein 2 [Trifolium pratense]